MQIVPIIRNCPVEMTFRCPRNWNDLSSTDVANVRFCDGCSENVYFCRTDEETIEHARQGHCIARECPVPDEHLNPTRDAVGRVRLPLECSDFQSEEVRLAYAREIAIDDSINNLKYADRSCPRCHYPAPDWRKTCRVCQFPIGRFHSEAT